MSALSDKKKTNRNSVLPDGPYLRQLRAETGLTQLELAFRLGVSERLVRKAEKGQRIDCRSLLLFKLFYQQQGLRIDAGRFGSTSELSTRETAVSFFKDCFVVGCKDSVAQWCVSDVTGSIDGQGTAGQRQVTALIQSFLAADERDTKWTIGPILSDSNATSIFWMRQTVGHHSKTLKEQGVALVVARTSVTAFDVFTFRSTAPP